jgi:tRNA-dihydrouridine synthase B
VRIGPYLLSNNLVVAPMAGVTDRPFRLLCKRFGAGYAVSEMVASNPDLRGTEKSRRRTDHVGEPPPVAVQIAGADPALMADAARYNVERGAAIIDLNMGCPAKKVCNVAAGRRCSPTNRSSPQSSLRSCAQSTFRSRLRSAPVATRKHRNRVAIARIAEEAGILALAVHGRTRACAFTGPVRIRHDPRRERSSLDSGHCQRRHRLARASAARVGRHRRRCDHGSVAPRRGVLDFFAEIGHFLAHGTRLAPPTVAEARAAIVRASCGSL